ncbi:hypothetical protein [Embleya sp. MST-111070]|uniref:hypothetical protein n=1 Tax=Embleya sp. MST-111070 TaxID=3398231 RepID=UPI003F739EEE
MAVTVAALGVAAGDHVLGFREALTGRQFDGEDGAVLWSLAAEANTGPHDVLIFGIAPWTSVMWTPPGG